MNDEMGKDGASSVLAGCKGEPDEASRSTTDRTTDERARSHLATLGVRSVRRTRLAALRGDGQSTRPSLSAASGWRRTTWRAMGRSLLAAVFVAATGLGLPQPPQAHGQVSSDGDLMVIRGYLAAGESGGEKSLLLDGQGVGWLLTNKSGTLARVAVTGKPGDAGSLRPHAEYQQFRVDLGQRLLTGWLHGDAPRFRRVGKTHASLMNIEPTIGWTNPHIVDRWFTLGRTAHHLVADPARGVFLYHLESRSTDGRRIDHFLEVSAAEGEPPRLEWYVDGRQPTRSDWAASFKGFDERWAVNPAGLEHGLLTPVDEAIAYRLVPASEARPSSDRVVPSESLTRPGDRWPSDGV